MAKRDRKGRKYQRRYDDVGRSTGATEQAQRTTDSIGLMRVPPSPTPNVLDKVRDLCNNAVKEYEYLESIGSTGSNGDDGEIIGSYYLAESILNLLDGKA